MNKKQYMAEFEHRIAGIPCMIGVTYFHYQPPWRGSAETAPSDLDYYGYHELEYDVLDRRGYRADWLERKMGDDDRVEVENTALQLLGHG